MRDLKEARRTWERGRDFRRLVSLLEQPLMAARVGREKRPVYLLVARLEVVPLSR